MSSSRLSAQEKRELEKITRFLALKVAQVIVQSRCGEKVKSQCNPNSSGVGCFNLAIEDSPEVLAETKRSMTDGLISSPVPLCIEISVKTVEGHSTVLETWCLGFLKGRSEISTIETDNTVIYDRMGMLLKSLLSVTRILPAYKISRRQNLESYVVRYRVYMGEPEIDNLGDSSMHVAVGNLETELGAIHLSVSYRTKVTLTPGPDNISVKIDHVEADASPTNDGKDGVSDEVTVAAFAEDRRTPVSEDTDDDTFDFLLPMSKSPSPSIADQDASPTPETAAADTCDGNEPRPRKASSGSPTSADEFVMVDAGSPFAETNVSMARSTDLGTFHRECHDAPLLQSFKDEMAVEEQIGDLTKQLERFEMNMRVFDDFVAALWRIKCDK